MFINSVCKPSITLVLAAEPATVDRRSPGLRRPSLAEAEYGGACAFEYGESAARKGERRWGSFGEGEVDLGRGIAEGGVGWRERAWVTLAWGIPGIARDLA